MCTDVIADVVSRRFLTNWPPNRRPLERRPAGQRDDDRQLYTVFRKKTYV